MKHERNTEKLFLIENNLLRCTVMCHNCELQISSYVSTISIPLFVKRLQLHFLMLQKYEYLSLGLHILEWKSRGTKASIWQYNVWWPPKVSVWVFWYHNWVSSDKYCFVLIHKSSCRLYSYQRFSSANIVLFSHTEALFCYRFLVSFVYNYI